jgi:hypothetical protein
VCRSFNVAISRGIPTKCRDVFHEGLEAGLTLDYCYERCLQGLDELVKSDPSSVPRARGLRLSLRKVYIDMSLEELKLKLL